MDKGGGAQQGGSRGLDPNIPFPKIQLIVGVQTVSSRKTTGLSGSESHMVE